LGVLIICPLLCPTAIWGVDGMKEEPVKVFEKAEVSPTPDKKKAVADLESKFSDLEKESKFLDEHFNRLNQRVLLLEEALLTKNKSIWGEIVTTILPISIAFIALLLTLRQLKINRQQLEVTRKHNEISVKPDITSAYRLGGPPGERVGIFLENNGLGPGTFLSLAIKTNGAVKQINNPQDLVDICVSLNIWRYGPTIKSPSVGHSLSAGKQYGIITFDLASIPQGNWNDITNAVLRMHLIVEYQDFYGNVWTHG